MSLFVRKIDGIRNPYKVKKLPLMARICKEWFDSQVLPHKKAHGKLFRGVYVRMLRLGMNPQGTFEIEFAGQKKELSFRVTNTQYTSLYLDRFKEVYEAEVSSLLDVLLPADGVFYDIGANFGYFSLFAASRPDFKGRIYSFEPNPETFCDLKKHVDDLGLNGKVFPNCMGLFERDDFIFVKPSGVRSGNFSLSDKTDFENGAYKVQIRRLDDLNLPKPDIMKIDTEGSEAGVLKGALRTLSSARPFIILESTLCNANPEKTLEPLGLLEKNGYVLFHAGWLSRYGADFRIQDEEAVEIGNRKKLSLSLLRYDQRFLLSERLNLLAVCKDRVAELTRHFDFVEEFLPGTLAKTEADSRLSS